MRRIEKEDSDSISDRSDDTSIYNVGTVNAGATEPERRPVRTIKIGNKKIDVLVDTGARANIIDEEAYRKLYPEGQTLRKAKSIIATIPHRSKPNTTTTYHW